MEIDKNEILNDFFIVKNGLEKYANEHIFKEFDLTASLYNTLMLIGRGQKNIAEILGETRASLSEKIQKLEKLGLIKRQKNKLDKRSWDLLISKKGFEIFDAINKKRRNGKLADPFFDLENRDIEVFAKVLKNMKQNLKNKKLIK